MVKAVCHHGRRLFFAGIQRIPDQMQTEEPVPDALAHDRCCCNHHGINNSKLAVAQAQGWAQTRQQNPEPDYAEQNADGSGRRTVLRQDVRHRDENFVEVNPHGQDDKCESSHRYSTESESSNRLGCFVVGHGRE